MPEVINLFSSIHRNHPRKLSFRSAICIAEKETFLQLQVKHVVSEADY
jgi:hypothetical protein